MASQEDEKAIDGLLRRSLAGRSIVTGDCPDAELLAAYFDKSLGPDEVARYELHFSTCTRCREQLAMMSCAAADESAHKVEESSLEPVLTTARLVEGIAKAASTWTPAAQKAPAASVITTNPQSTPSKWIDLRWLVPVAAVLLVGTFTFFRFASRGRNTPPNSEVAISKSAPPQSQAAPEPEPETSVRDSAAPTKRMKKANPPASRPPVSHPALAGNTNTSASALTSSAAGGNATSRSMRVTPGRSTAFRGSYMTRSQGAIVQERPRASADSAPPAPAPELNASLSKVPVTTDSADAVKSPAPPPPSEAEQKSETTQVTTPNGFRGSSAISSLEAAKAAKTRYTTTVVIKTPDPNVMYRITGGLVEISEDGGANWQGERSDPPVDFVAGSAPESHVCWLVGRAGVVFLTEDGKNWQKIPSPVSKDLVAVEAQSAVSVTITAKDGQKWSTDDAGKTWHAEE
jgi:hypothetical protein